jgi:hypothetical protein
MKNMQAIFHEFNNNGEFGNTLPAKICETSVAICFNSAFKLTISNSSTFCGGAVNLA